MSTTTEVTTEQINVEDVIQLDPEKTTNPLFAGMYMTVNEVKPWGVVCYIMLPDKELKVAFYRAEYGTFARIGQSKWIAELSVDATTQDRDAQASSNAMIVSDSEH